MSLIKTYSKRLSPPFSGQVQIAESERARALTLDGTHWEIQFIHSYRDDSGAPQRRHVRVANLPQAELGSIAEQGSYQGQPIDDRILQLAQHLADVELPFPAGDEYEYWLLDAQDGSPLAFIFSCTDASETNYFPVRPEWTALPAALMPIDKTEEELQRGDPPVNYRFERLVAERAGINNPKARWFRRRPDDSDDFPPLLVREDWQEEDQHDLCQRYLQRQSTRLLMLHGLERQDRGRMEQAVRPNVMELARFYALYPEVIDQELMNTLRVEARLRGVSLDSSGNRFK